MVKACEKIQYFFTVLLWLFSGLEIVVWHHSLYDKKFFPVFDIANQLLTNNSPSTKEKPKVRYLLPLVIAFLVAENEKQQLEDWPQANLGYVPDNFAVCRDPVNSWEFCKLKIMPIFVFAIRIQHISPSWVFAPTHHIIVIWRLLILSFSFTNEVGCSCHYIVFRW